MKSYDIYALMVRWSYRLDFLTNPRFVLIVPVVRDVVAQDRGLVWC